LIFHDISFFRVNILESKNNYKFTLYRNETCGIIGMPVEKHRSTHR